MKNLEKNLKALANKRRLEILKSLKGGRASSVGDIAEKIKLSFKATSRHLLILFRADILDKEQKDNQVFYKIAANPARVVKDTISIL